MRSQVVTTSISGETISTAVSLLLDELRIENLKKGETSEAIESATSIFEQLDKRAQALESILSVFTYQVRHDIATIRHQQNMLAPIHRLPAELLTDIFQKAVSELHTSRTDTKIVHEEDMSSYKGDEESDTMMPDSKEVTPATEYSLAVTIASVSSHWCHVARSTPGLWSYLDMKYDLEVTKRLLTRSKGTPLHITCSPKVASSHENHFLQLVIPHIGRWKSFDSSTRVAGLLEDLGVGGYSAPVLERVILRGGVEQSEFTYRQLPSLFLERSPNLHHLHITPMCYPLGSKVLSGLTNLSVSAMVGTEPYKMEHFEILFSTSPNLTTVFIRGCLPTTSHFNVFSAKLPNLSSICLFDLYPRLTIALLSSIFTDPGHQTTVKVFGGWGGTWFETVSPYPTRANTLLDVKLRSLTWLSAVCELDGNYYDPQDGEEWCMRIEGGTGSNGNRVSCLEIHTHKNRIEEVISTFFFPGGASMIKILELQLGPYFPCRTIASNLYLCPRLEHLVITASSHWWNDLGSLIAALPSRCRSIGDNVHSSLPYPDVDSQLTQLTLRGLGNLQPILGLVKERCAQAQHPLIQDGFLKRLKTLNVYYLSDFFIVPESDTIAMREIELLLAELNIKFVMD